MSADSRVSVDRDLMEGLTSLMKRPSEVSLTFVADEDDLAERLEASLPGQHLLRPDGGCGIRTVYLADEKARAVAQLLFSDDDLFDPMILDRAGEHNSWKDLGPWPWE